MRARVRSPWLFVGLIVLVGFTFWHVTQFEFVSWDDGTYVTDNPQVRAGLTTATIAWAFTTTNAPYWHPLTWLSHAIDVELFGLDAGAHHATSVLIHLANTLLLFVLLARMTGATGRSAAVAALFAVHPMHVESVAWVAERKDVLSTCFLLVTVAAYVTYVRSPRWPRYLLVVAAYTLALMSKPMVVTLPILLLLLDIWPLRRLGTSGTGGVSLTRALVEKLPLVVLAAIVSVSTVLVQAEVGAIAGLTLVTVPERLANAVVAYATYVMKTFWPAGLAAFYPYGVIEAWQVLLSLLVVGLLTVGAVRWRSQAPYLFVGWIWYLTALLPVIGLLQAGQQASADRFTYVALIGIFVIVVWGTVDVASQWRVGLATVRMTALVVVVLSSVLARHQLAYWSDSLSLWQRVVDVVPPNARAFENLGSAQRDRGLLDAAVSSYTESVRLAPSNHTGQNSLGLALVKQGRFPEAASRFNAAIAAKPDFVEAHNNLGNALATMGRVPEAIESYKKVLALQAESPEARTNLGNALASANHLNDAVEQYRMAVALDPASKEARLGLSAALIKQGKAADAIGHLQAALALDPEFAEAHNVLGAALVVAGNVQGAETEYSEALRLKPNLVTAHFNLAMLLIKQGRIAPARSHLERASAIDPGYRPAQQLLEVLRRQPIGG